MVSRLGLEPQEEPQPTAPRRQPPHGMGTRRRQCPLLTPRRSPSLRTRQSPSAIALFLSKKGNVKHVPREAAGLPRARRVLNATRLGSVVLTLRELRRITKNFSDDQLVGVGAFGKVYKGILTNGDVIAVKRFATTVTGPQDVQYENEAQHLMRLRHPNIVQLIGYCSETEMKLVRHNGKFVRAEQSERLLCLEYMTKGSLRGHLSDEFSGLDWKTRYKIIKGICYGLHYLHEEWEVTPIIHMDLKPANILLDDNMVPKIADFGLSRLFGEEQTRTCTRSCKGTPGYMAPEYLEKGVITKKFDIFSLGVIIIEVITGLKGYPTEENETTFQQYIDTVLNNWRHRLRKAQGYISQETDYQQINKCIQIGLLCVKFDRLKRPTIVQIIKMLERSDEAYKNERECFILQANQEQIAANGSNTNTRLCFLNGLEPPVYTNENLTSQNGAAIRLAMIEGDKVVTSGALSEAKIEILVLRGDFSNKYRDNWTEDEFEKHIVIGQDEHDLVLGTVWLTNGMVELSQIQFSEGSCSKNVIMAARVCKSIKTSGRVQEAIMKPVKVLDRRNKPTKLHPLRLDEDVYRLEEIAKDGAYHKRLLEAQIYKVRGFLKALNEDSSKLRAILKMENQQPSAHRLPSFRSVFQPRFSLQAMWSTTKLEDITTGQQSYKVAGRLIRLWDAKNLASKSAELISIDGVLLDEHGTMAQITVPKRLEKQFRPLLSQGTAYMFSDITATSMRNKSYIYHHQNYMLQFKSSTKVHKLHSRGSTIPKFSFSFCPFDETPNKKAQEKPLIDLIGVISSIGPFDFASPLSQKKNRKIHIRNLEEQTQEIVLWGEFGESFDEELVLQKAAHGKVIAIFVGLAAGTYTGNLEASSTSATEIYLDLELPEVDNFRNSYQWETPILQKQLPNVVRVSPMQAAGQVHDLHHISQLPISSFQGGTTYPCIAKITGVVPSTEWYYKACQTCNKGYNNSTETPRCSCKDSLPKPMYKLPLTIADDSKSINAITFSLVAQELVEYSAVQASQNMKIPADEHVTALNNAIGKKRLFHIGMNTVYSTKFSNYVLKKSFKLDDEKDNPVDTPTNTIRNTHTNLTEDTSQTPNFQQSLEGTSTSSTTATTNEEPVLKKSKQAHNNTESNN